MTKRGALGTVEGMALWVVAGWLALAWPAWAARPACEQGQGLALQAVLPGATRTEIWDRSGGGGVQMTERRTQQKDTGEPAFSPDGRYLYFSDDSTPGGVFDSSKDPNTQIYVIRRLDRETGEITPFVTGPGGSIRPTPSPDGKSLAFIRRDRYKSVLYVMDLESGRETPIHDALDRDLQETWAIHGVYPAISWTPDNRSIVFWADSGQIFGSLIAWESLAVVAFGALCAMGWVLVERRAPEPVVPLSLFSKPTINLLLIISIVSGAIGIGCLLMLARSAVAVPVFALSLFGYIALYIGDIIHGVFAAMGTPQVVVLTVVVAIAAGLWAVARLFRTRGVLA